MFGKRLFTASDSKANMLSLEIPMKGYVNICPKDKTDFELLGSVLETASGSIMFYGESGSEFVQVKKDAPGFSELRALVGNRCLSSFSVRKSGVKSNHQEYVRIDSDVIEPILSYSFEGGIVLKTKKTGASAVADGAKHRPDAACPVSSTEKEKDLSMPLSTSSESALDQNNANAEGAFDQDVRSNEYLDTTPLSEQTVNKPPKRADDAFYADSYNLEIVNLRTEDFSQVRAYFETKPSNIVVRRTRRDAPSDRMALYVENTLIGAITRAMNPAVVELHDVGYAITVVGVGVHVEDRLPEEGFGSYLKEVVTEYSVSLRLKLVKPLALQGEQVRLCYVLPPAQAGKYAAGIHSSAVRACGKYGLLPAEAAVSEMMAAGMTKPAIVECMGWTVGEVARYADDAYEKLGVHNKNELGKKLVPKGYIKQIKKEPAPTTVPAKHAKQSSATTGASLQKQEPAKAKSAESCPAKNATLGAMSRNEERTYAAIKNLKNGNRLSKSELAVLTCIALGVTGDMLVERLGCPREDLRAYADSAYKKLGIASRRKKDELLSLLEKAKEEKAKPAKSASAKKVSSRQQIIYVGVADVFVRSHGPSCAYKSHTMVPVTASVTVLTAARTLKEVEFMAFYCEQCGMYFVTKTAFERVKKSGWICCRVVGIEDAYGMKKGDDRWAQYDTESIIHQYGYNVNKAEGLSSSERQSILSFIIENDIQTQYEIIGHIETLIDTRTGMRNMQDAIAKWKEDVHFLEHYRAPKRSLKVDKLYARKSLLR